MQEPNPATCGFQIRPLCSASTKKAVANAQRTKWSPKWSRTVDHRMELNGMRRHAWPQFQIQINTWTDRPLPINGGTRRMCVRYYFKRRAEPGSTLQFVSKATRLSSRVAFWLQRVTKRQTCDSFGSSYVTPPHRAKQQTVSGFLGRSGDHGGGPSARLPVSEPQGETEGQGQDKKQSRPPRTRRPQWGSRQTKRSIPAAGQALLFRRRNRRAL